MKITKRQLRRIIREAIDESQTAGPPISGDHAIALGGSYHESRPRPDDDYDPLNLDDEDQDDAAYNQGYDDGFNGYPSNPVAGGDYHAGYEEGVNAAKDEEVERDDDGYEPGQGYAGIS